MKFWKGNVDVTLWWSAIISSKLDEMCVCHRSEMESYPSDSLTIGLRFIWYTSDLSLDIFILPDYNWGYETCTEVSCSEDGTKEIVDIHVKL